MSDALNKSAPPVAGPSRDDAIPGLRRLARRCASGFRCTTTGTLLLLAACTPTQGPAAATAPASASPSQSTAPSPADAPTTSRRVTGTAPVQALDLRLDGRPVAVDVALPQAAPRGLVVLAHGFTRTRQTQRGHVERLAAEGLVSVAPDLPYLVDSRDNARALRDLVAHLRAGVSLPSGGVPAGLPVVLVGFSAGGLAALLAADAPGVVGYIGLDPFDRPGGVGRSFAATLQVPAILLHGPSSACNAFRIAAPWSQALPKLRVDRAFPATHCDFEAPSDTLCRWACGAPTPAVQQAIAEALREGVLQLLAEPR